MRYYLIFLFFWIFQSCQPAQHIPDEIQIWLDQLKAERGLLAQSLHEYNNALLSFNETKRNQYDSFVALSDSTAKASFQFIQLLEKGVAHLQTDSSARAWTDTQIAEWCQQTDAQILQLKPLLYQLVDSAYLHKPAGFPQKIWIDSVFNVWNAQSFKTYNIANKLLYISLLETSIYALLCQLSQTCKPQEQYFGVPTQTLPYLEFVDATIYKSYPRPLRVQVSEQIVLPNPKIHLRASDPNNPNKEIPITYSQNKVVIIDTPKTKGKHEIYFRMGLTHESTGESIGLSRGWVYVVK